MYFFMLLFFFFLYFLISMLFCLCWIWFVHHVVGLDSVWPALFWNRRRQVVSIMCEKCLLYSFKKFQGDYKTLYINPSISTCSEGVLSILLGSTFQIQRFDSCFEFPRQRCLVFPGGGGEERHNSLRCKTQVLIVWLLFFFFSFFFSTFLDIDKDHVYK